MINFSEFVVVLLQTVNFVDKHLNIATCGVSEVLLLRISILCRIAEKLLCLNLKRGVYSGLSVSVHGQS